VLTNWGERREGAREGRSARKKERERVVEASHARIGGRKQGGKRGED
jgi:hypothetical protein